MMMELFSAGWVANANNSTMIAAQTKIPSAKTKLAMKRTNKEIIRLDEFSNESGSASRMVLTSLLPVKKDTH